MKHNRSYIIALILLLGFGLRLTLLIQNRDFILDELNVGRNLFEKSYGGLFHPLDYSQYAPPLFLVFSKLSLQIWGAYEWALRLFPFLSSVASLVLFWKLAERLKVRQALFYPLLLLATAPLFLRYATELKQYSSDMLVTLSLIWLALSCTPARVGRLRFFGIWALAGSIAIWLSMPSVFVWAGVGVYYVVDAVKRRDFSSLLLFLAASALVGAQFLLYYSLVLGDSVSSDYLLTWHRDYLLNWDFSSAEIMRWNGIRLSRYFEMGGTESAVFYVNLLCFIIGASVMLRRQPSVFWLLLTPVLLMIVAVFLHKFTLLPRVCIFSYSILLLFVGVGLEWVFERIRLRSLKMLLVVVCLYGTALADSFRFVAERPRFESTTMGYAFLSTRKLDAIYVTDLLRAPAIFYTRMHPDSSRWKFMSSALVLDRELNWDSAFAMGPQRLGLMHSWMMDEVRTELLGVAHTYYSVKDSLMGHDLGVYILEKRKKVQHLQHADTVL